MTPEQFLDYHDIDLRYIEGPRYTGSPLEENADTWGVLRKRAMVSTIYDYSVVRNRLRRYEKRGVSLDLWVTG
jgi:hypothetical protein